MAAFSLESAHYTKQRVEIALKNANPAIKAIFKALLDSLAQDKRNVQLQFLPITAADIDTGADGKVVATGVAKLYGAYLKRVSDVDTTGAYYNFADDATDNSAAGDVRAVLFANAASEEMIYVNPIGEPLADGLVVSATTAAGGTTESAATESANGFVIVGG